MDIRTHQQIAPNLCGLAQEVGEGYSLIQLTPTPDMAVDAFHLVHGGFIFGLADYAAMLAVNDPNVVLAAADVKFLKPVRVEDILTAEARVREIEGKKHIVDVDVKRDADSVFRGSFTCFVLAKHVLETDTNQP